MTKKSEVRIYGELSNFLNTNNSDPEGYKILLNGGGHGDIPYFKLLESNDCNEYVIWVQETKLQNLKSLLSLISSSTKKFYNGKCLETYENHGSKIIQEIKNDLINTNVKQITCIGFSTGGSIASVIATILNKDIGYKNRFTKGIKAYVFGTAPTFSLNLCRETKEFITNIVLENDFVPKTCNDSLSLPGMVYVLDADKGYIRKGKNQRMYKSTLRESWGIKNHSNICYYDAIIQFFGYENESLIEESISENDDLNQEKETDNVKPNVEKEIDSKDQKHESIEDENNQNSKNATFDKNPKAYMKTKCENNINENTTRNKNHEKENEANSKNQKLANNHIKEDQKNENEANDRNIKQKNDKNIKLKQEDHARIDQKRKNSDNQVFQEKDCQKPDSIKEINQKINENNELKHQIEHKNSNKKEDKMNKSNVQTTNENKVLSNTQTSKDENINLGNSNDNKSVKDTNEKECHNEEQIPIAKNQKSNKITEKSNQKNNRDTENDVDHVYHKKESNTMHFDGKDDLNNQIHKSSSNNLMKNRKNVGKVSSLELKKNSVIQNHNENKKCSKQLNDQNSKTKKKMLKPNLSESSINERHLVLKEKPIQNKNRKKDHLNNQNQVIQNNSKIKASRSNGCVITHRNAQNSYLKETCPTNEKKCKNNETLSRSHDLQNKKKCKDVRLSMTFIQFKFKV